MVAAGLEKNLQVAERVHLLTLFQSVCTTGNIKTAAEALGLVSSFYDHDILRLAYQPPASSTFLSERTSHQQPAATSQQYYSLRTNQHQPSASSQPNRLVETVT
jgi:hypothetical protein